MPTIGNETAGCSAGVSRETRPTGFGWRRDLGFGFMVLLFATTKFYHIHCRRKELYSGGRRVTDRSLCARLTGLEFTREPIDKLDRFRHQLLCAGNVFFEAPGVAGRFLFQGDQSDVDPQ